MTNAPLCSILAGCALLGLPANSLAQRPLSELAALDGDVGDSFGSAVAVDGDRAVIGAPWDDDAGASSGSAYVFERGAGGWVQVAKLTAGDAEAGDEFGHAVGVSGDTIVIGAWREDTGGADAGAAYVFEPGGGAWSQTARLSASDASADDRFGEAVAISGVRLIVGASGHDLAAANTGAAYVFERAPGGTWGPNESALLRADDAQGGDRYGSAVSITGARALVGAPFEDAAALDSGAAYVMERGTGGAWLQVAKLFPAEAAPHDHFGHAVSLDATQALVGAPGDDNAGAESGSAYLFALDGGGAWAERERLAASDGSSQDQLGVAVALRGSVALVGALYAETDGTVAGGAYLYLRDASGAFGPVETERLDAPSPGSGQRFGAAVALSSGELVVGEPGGGGAAPSSGLAHARALRWSQAARPAAPPGDCGVELLTASDGVAGDALGVSLALESGVALVGAPYASPAGPGAGAVYVYQRDALGGFGPQETAKLVASDAEHSDGFGRAVALWGSTALIGASGGDGAVINSGAAYVFQRGPDGWAETAKLWAGDGELLDAFGGAVALEGGTAVIGAHLDDGYRGAVYAFERGAGGWVETQKLLASDGQPQQYFGRELALSGETLWVGVAADSEREHHAGAVYVFERTTGGWVETAKLFASDPGDEAFFGTAVALEDDRALVGAWGADGDLGAAYVFERRSGGWVETRKLEGVGVPGDGFGRAVALAGDRALVGAPWADVAGQQTGAAYLYELGSSGWALERVLVAPDGASGDGFGDDLVLSTATALVGAGGNDDHGATSGSAYVYHPVDGTIVSACRTSPNSAGPGATIGASGSTSVAANELALHATGAVPDQPCVFFYGPAATELPFGNGFLCVAAGPTGVASLKPPLRTDASGAVVRHLNLAQPPADAGPFAILPGSTWHFQLVFRDPFAGPSDFDFSDGLRVSFCP